MPHCSELPLQDAIGRLQSRVPGLMASANIPGLSISLVRDGTVAWSGAFGLADADSKRPLDTETVFEAASLSKPVYSYPVLKLCEPGRLSLDTPLVEYLPSEMRSQPVLFDRIENDERLQRLTARHILTQSSGLPNWGALFGTVRIMFEPGTRWTYSGEAFLFLHRLIEHVTGEPAQAFLRHRVTEPLGMKASAFVWREGDSPAAIGHDENGVPLEKREWPQVIAAASLHCTPSDYARFVAAVMQPRVADPYRLTPASTAEMLRPQVQANENGPWDPVWPREPTRLIAGVWWGLGWAVQRTAGGDTFWHWGSQPGYRSFAIGDAVRGCGAVFMANSQNLPQIWGELLAITMGGEHPALAWLGVRC